MAQTQPSLELLQELGWQKDEDAIHVPEGNGESLFVGFSRPILFRS